jgi:pimeloyl-ACP methyl ester carboxylesterase
MTDAPPALVFVHGAVLNRRMWDPVIANLPPEWRTATLDLPGHGARADEPFTVTRAVSVVERAVSDLGAPSVILVGDSLGSYVSLASAAALGARLGGAVLGGCTADLRGPTVLLYLSEIALSRLVPADRLRRTLEARLSREYRSGPAMVASGLRPAAFAEAVAELRRIDVRALLAAIPAPLMLVNGARDRRHRWGERAALAAAPAATLRIVPGVGHGVSLERPGAFASLVAEFAGDPPQR